MRKVKLIFGTYNSQPPEEKDSKVEDYYQKSYKTFLTTLYNNSSIKLSLHYSGSLFDWLELKHSEFLSVLQEMINSKQVELLSGTYHDPALTLLSIPDRVGQMEKLTTYIRKNFSKKPRGCFLSENVWDSSLVSSLQSCGFEYIFLEDNQFLSSGVVEDNLCKPVITEDQGKLITVIPINTKLTSMFLNVPPKDLIDYIQDNSHKDGVFTIMLKGELLNSNNLNTKDVKIWIETFNNLLLENSNWIETIHPNKFLKQYQKSLEKIYFPLYSIESMRNKPLPINSQRELNRLNRHLGALGEVSHWINSGFFKQFLSRYSDASLIYSKMVYINLLVNQIKGDKSRKKTAREELWRAQSHFVYWHGEHLGIYDKDLRERCYKFLIEAEKSTREKGIFKAGISLMDIDLDGKKEALYQGETYNSYITTNGGVLFQLEFLKKNRNLISTVKRIEESYHTEDNNGFDTYPRKMFHDHFLTTECTIEEFSKQNFKELGSFIESGYEYDNLNRDNKCVILISKGYVNNLGYSHNVTITKKYQFNKKGIVLTYNIENNDDLALSTVFSSEFNLSLSEISNEPVPHFSSDKEHFMLNKNTISKDVNNLIIDDVAGSIKVNLSFSTETSSFWTIPQYSDTLENGNLLKIYQFTSFVPQWKIKIAPRKSWSVAINLSLS